MLILGGRACGLSGGALLPSGFAPSCGPRRPLGFLGPWEGLRLCKIRCGEHTFQGLHQFFHWHPSGVIPNGLALSREKGAKKLVQGILLCDLGGGV